MHEIQHLIQVYEGSANGTSSREAYEEFLANYERARADVKKEGLVKVSREKNILQSERIKKLTPEKQDILKRYLALKKIDDTFGYHPGILKRFLDFIKGKKLREKINLYQFYKLYAGEAEARNVQRRANMSEEELRERQKFLLKLAVRDKRHNG